jgi:subtilisin family serine protease
MKTSVSRVLAALAVGTFGGAQASSRPASATPVALQEPAARPGAPGPTDRWSPQRAGAPEPIAADGPVRVIVGLRVPWNAEGRLAPAALEEQRVAIDAAQQALLAELGTTRATVIHSFASIPYQALEVTPAALAQLQSSALVASVEEDVLLRPDLAESVPLIQGDQAWAAGYDGTGIAVAVLDTGVEATHSFFGGRVLAEACFSTTATDVSTLCPNGLGSQTGAGAASPAACAGISGCDHGTHVAGIAAGAGAAFSGVAKNASVLGVQVFSKFTSAAGCIGTTAPCVSAYTTDVIRGLEHVLSLKDTYAIASVNMSLGGGKYTSDAACDAANTAFKAAIDNLRSFGIASVISSGNSGYTDGIGSPGCISTAVAVGSTSKQDAVSSFSNSSPMVELLAPGEAITSSVTGNTFGAKSGTSMAAPHVAGAWAVLKQQSPSATVAQVLAALSSSGLGITDARNGVAKPRLRIRNALEPGLYVDDVSLTEGNSGTANASFAVTLTPPATGTVTVQYQTANGTAASGTDYTAASGTLTFLAGEATKTVTVAVNGDTLEEPDETLFVNLSGATGGVTIRDAQAVGTIRNDDIASCSAVAPGVLDGTFEAGVPWSAWTVQTSTNFGTPLCDSGCGNGGGTAPPYAGANWAWFGGIAAVESATLGQTLTLPVSSDLRLRFQMRFGGVSAPAADTLVVSVDGTPARTYTEPAVAENAYTLREVNLTPFANGASHALLFAFTHPDAGGGNLTVDNVELVDCAGGGGLPALSINDVSVAEGNAGTSTATFTVSLSAPSAQTVTVNYATANGTASAGSDYVAASGTLSFPPSSTSQSVSVTVNGDTTTESNETFFVNLSGATDATIADTQGVGTINDDDVALPTLSINDVSVMEFNSGTTSANFTVSLSAPSAQTVTVSYTTANGTASAGSDYVAASGTVTFPPYSILQFLPITVNGDTAVEADETFHVNLNSPTNATIADGQGVGTITNDDEALPALSIGDVSVAEGNSGAKLVTFTVTLSPASAQVVTFKYATASGTATADPAWSGTTAQGRPVNFAVVNGGTEVYPIALGGVISGCYTFETTFYERFAVSGGSFSKANPGTGCADRYFSGTFTSATAASGTFTQAPPTTACSCPYGLNTTWTAAPTGATTPGDYGPTWGSSFIFPGATTATIQVLVDGDTAVEPSETFFVDLSDVSGATLADGQGTGTISDDDGVPVPALSIDDVTVSEGNSGTTNATFTVSLSFASTQPVTVNYATANGSATAGVDYVAGSGTLTFPAGSLSQSLGVAVNGDTAAETAETFFVNLSGATNATLADAQGAGTINDDDGSVDPSASSFYTLTPCRVLDTRDPAGALGGPALQAGTPRNFALTGPKCAIPLTAKAVSVNLTVTAPAAQGNLRVFPAGVPVPLVSSVNFVAGQTRANNAVVSLGGGSVTVLSTAATHFILDVNGYFE